MPNQISDVERLLRSVGKENFVEYYKSFKDPNCSNQIIINNLLASGKIKSLNAARTIATQGKRIVAMKGEKTAMDIIANHSARLPVSVINKAQKLLSSM